MATQTLSLINNTSSSLLGPPVSASNPSENMSSVKAAPQLDSQNVSEGCRSNAFPSGFIAEDVSNLPQKVYDAEHRQESLISRSETPTPTSNSRCPPDGAAAHYDVSPTSSTVSTSPVTQAVPEPKLAGDTELVKRLRQTCFVTSSSTNPVVTRPVTISTFSGHSAALLQTPIHKQPSCSTSKLEERHSDLSSAFYTRASRSQNHTNTVPTSLPSPPAVPLRSPGAKIFDVFDQTVQSTEPSKTLSEPRANSTKFDAESRKIGSLLERDVSKNKPVRSLAIERSISEMQCAASGSYGRQHSLPIEARHQDGRSVVPWIASDMGPAVQEAAAAALGTPNSFAPDSPQWVPPQSVKSLAATQNKASKPVESPSKSSKTTSKSRQSTRRYFSENAPPNTMAEVFSQSVQIHSLPNPTVEPSDHYSGSRRLKPEPVWLAEFPSGEQVLSRAQTDNTEWYRAQRRSEKLARAAALDRQISAGPTFNSNSRSHQPSVLSRSQHQDFHRVKRSLASAERGAMFRSVRLPPEDATRMLHARQSDNWPQERAFYLSDGRVFYVDDFVADHRIPRRSKQTRNHRGTVDEDAAMTQSYFFPSDSGWTSSNELPDDGEISSISSARHRRPKPVTRSLSQRTAEQIDPRFAIVDTPELQADPPNYHPHSLNHSVAMETVSAVSGWGPVMVKCRSRKSDAPQHNMERYLASSRKHPINGCSMNDLAKSDATFSAQAHHQSASVICEQLDSQLWFHPTLNRSNAEKLLKGNPVGSFLVRPSETNKNELSLSIRRESGYLHMKIAHDPMSGHYVLGEYSQPYPSVSAMIHRYSKSLLPIRGTTPILLRFPVSREP